MEHPDDRYWRMNREEASGRRIAALDHDILRSLSPETLAEVYGGEASAPRHRDSEFLMDVEREILRGDPLRAIEQLDRDMRTRSRVPAAVWALRGLANLALGRWPDAINDADTALTEDPDFAPTHAIKAEALLREGDYAQALALADKALSLDPHEPRGLGVRAAACYEYGRFREAVDSGTRALAMAPNWALPREARAAAHLKLFNIIEAVADARLLLEFEPGNAVARHVLRAIQ